ncbi:hypothetical protein G647_08856 [Cladophialophora carrionii CBS 160.54]|uniref:Uncharacterized protein n=1 Tax=Cladophialophora carrionii CBS 160.54 TaxID=1279043 RepID=V9D1I7_9EURO|nr:uncharacterized protein G647_08856 [Cladophialophora carrionii CBS 160.54]ETI19842.1 hypothetical protein G647_08856 [Cladophialophora carrionii CBS 160.54]
MSTIRFFDSIPHIVRYGMQNEREGKCWILFWRNAVCFRVSVSREDVNDTPFATKWLELNKEGAPRVEGMKKWVERWNELCDCIISQCMPVLQELAPPTRQWKTLEDHLRTPAYELKMVADQETGDAVAKITSGPVEKPSYEHHLLPFSDFESMPEDLPRYRAQDLRVLGQEKDWRHPPAKVQTQDGEVLYFLSCNKPTRNARNGEISNASLNRINAYSILHSKLNDGVGGHIPKLLGVVVSDAGGGLQHWRAQGHLSATNQSADAETGKELLVAGVLLTYVSKARRWAVVEGMFADQKDSAEVLKCKEKWKRQIASTVQLLHGHGIAIGGRLDSDNPWSYINQHTVHIAPIESGEDTNDVAGLRSTLLAADAWLMLQANCTTLPPADQQQEQDKKNFEEQKTMDWKAVDKLFKL